MRRLKSRTTRLPLRKYYIGIGVVLQTAALFFTTSAFANSDLLFAKLPGPLGLEYPFEAKEMDAVDTLSFFSRVTGMPVEANVEGKIVSLDNMNGTVTDFLDTFADQTGCVWWYDGMRVRLEPLASMRSAIVGAQGISMEALESAMNFMGLSSDKFETRISDDGMFFKVVGPEGYINDVERLMTQIIDARVNRRAGLPIVYKHHPAPNEIDGVAPATPGAQIMRTDRQR